MKKILVPTDFSERAEYALDVAIQLAQSSDQEVLVELLNILDPERIYTITEDGDYKDLKNDDKYRELLISKTGRKMEDLIEAKNISNVKGTVELGKIDKVIADYVDKEGIDLVVKGAHGTSVYEEMLFVSNSDKIIHSTSCPVLTIRKPTQNFKCDNVVFAIDLESDLAKVIPQIKEMQRIFGSSIHFVYINTPVSFYNNRRIQEKKDQCLTPHHMENYTFTIYNDFTIETGIAHFADDINADVVALASHHFDGLIDHIQTSRVSDIVIDETERPVLTFAI